MSKDVVAFCMQISIKRSKPSAEKIDISTRPSRDHLPRKGKTEHNQLLKLRAEECQVCQLCHRPKSGRRPAQDRETKETIIVVPGRDEGERNKGCVFFEEKLEKKKTQGI